MGRKKSMFNSMALSNMLCDSMSNNREFMKYRDIALNVYRWKNLPNGIESRHIEEALFNNGQAFFVEDPTYGFLCLPSSTSGRLNFYGDPLGVRITGVGFTCGYSIDKGVRILNNDSARPSVIDVLHFTEKIEAIERTIDKNLEQQRNPYFYRTTKNNEFSMKQLDAKIKNDDTAIFIDTELDNGNTSGLVKEDIWKDFRALEYNKLKLEYEKELLTSIGINTVIQKDSGMNDTELNSNNEHIQIILDIGYNQRKIARDLINSKFNTNIEVEKVVETLNIDKKEVEIND